MKDIESVREAFSRMAGRPESDLDLARGALLISRLHYPDLDESVYLAQLDDLGRRLAEDLSATAAPAPEAVIRRANRLIYKEEGFKGNPFNYYNPENSFLNRVLERKTGIPVSLGVVYIEVGKRAGLDIRGVGLPGHFIVALYHDGVRRFIDPFDEGKILSETECRFKVLTQSRFGEKEAGRADLLDPVGPKCILARILRNLKGIYRHANREIMAFQMIEWILALTPDAPGELRERGLIYDAMGDADRAVRDLEAYLALSPQAPDRNDILEKIEDLKRAPRRIH